MKKKIFLILLLSLITVFLGVILYILIITTPKQIKNENIGTMYTFGNISFNLTSDKYIPLESFTEQAKENNIDTNYIMVLGSEETDKYLTILNNENDLETISIIDETISDLKNPLKHLSLEKDLPNKIDSEKEIGRVELVLYTRTNTNAVLYKYTYSDNTISYFMDLKIKDSYYTLLVNEPNRDNIEDIMEFINTVHITL